MKLINILRQFENTKTKTKNMKKKNPFSMNEMLEYLPKKERWPKICDIGLSQETCCSCLELNWLYIEKFDNHTYLVHCCFSLLKSEQKCDDPPSVV